jgi:phytoene/squalene synthetase
MYTGVESNHTLASSITWNASKQTYYTIRFLVDRDRIEEAFKAYAYFRWVDDRLDVEMLPRSKRVAFVLNQRELMERCYLGDPPSRIVPEERLLVDLIRTDHQVSTGLQAYIRNMMAVMAFDADRRGRWIQQRELTQYTRWLSVAVTEALHYFIGHDCQNPPGEMRYRAATAAHITHMLRDTLEDNQTGFFNISREYLENHHILPQDVTSGAYRSWVQSRVQLARELFRSGRNYLARVDNFRCRLAGYAYIARFEGLLDVIAKEGYQLRANYAEHKGIRTGFLIGWSAVSLAVANRRPLGRLSTTLPNPDETG